MGVGNVIAPGSDGHAASRLRFLRHLLEMTLAMMVGMVASAAVFLTAVGLTVDEGLASIRCSSCWWRRSA
jgi:hypothetical protein